MFGRYGASHNSYHLKSKKIAMMVNKRVSHFNESAMWYIFVFAFGVAVVLLLLLFFSLYVVWQLPFDT